MRLRIWGRLAAAVVGAAALAGSASAQAPAPVVVPQVVAQPAPGPTVPTVVVPRAPAALPPAAAAAVPTAPAPGTTYVAANGGGTSHRGFVMNASGGYFGTSCGLGQQCNSGCGSFRSDLGLVFGSCRSFFAPCGPTLRGKHGSCNHPVIGPGASGPFNPCQYDSYLNH